MAVVRQQQRFFNKPIGVTRLNTGEAELWQQVSQVADSFQNMAIDYESTVGVQKAQEAAMGIPISDIISIDPYTKKPVALSSIEQYGAVKAKAYSDIINNRFLNSIGDEIQAKGQEYALKYQNSASFQKQMSKYVQDMSESADGMYSQAILETGTEYVAKATRTMKVAEHNASVKAAKKQSILIRMQAERNVHELTSNGADSTDVLIAIRKLKSAIDTEYKFTDNVGNYFSQLDSLSFTKASSAVTGLLSGSQNLSKVNRIKIEAALRDPVSVSLLSQEDSLIIREIHQLAGYKNLDKLADQFKFSMDIDEAIQAARTETTTEEWLEDFNNKLVNANDELATNPTLTNAISIRKHLISQAPIDQQDATAEASLSLVSKTLTQKVLDEFSGSNSDFDKLILKNILSVLGSGKYRDSEYIKEIPVGLHNTLEQIIQNFNDEEINTIINATKSTMQNAADSDTIQRQLAKEATAELEAERHRRQIIIDSRIKLSIASNLGKFRGRINFAEQSNNTKELLKILKEQANYIVSTPDIIRLITPDQASTMGAQIAKLDALDQKNIIRAHTDNTNKVLSNLKELINSGVNGETIALALQKADSIISAQESLGFHKPSTLNTWRLNIANAREEISSREMVTAHEEDLSSLVGVLEIMEENATNGIYNEKHYNDAISQVLDLHKNFPAKFTAHAKSDFLNRIEIIQAESVIRTALSNFITDTNGNGVSLTMFNKIISVASNLDIKANDIKNRFGENTAATGLAEKLREAYTTPNFLSNYNTFSNTIRNRNEEMQTVFLEEKRIQNAIDSVIRYGSGSSLEDQKIYENNVLLAGKDTVVDYTDINTFITNGVENQFSKRFKKMAELGVLPFGFVNTVNGMAQAGIDPESGEVIFNILTSLSQGEVGTDPINLFLIKNGLTDKTKSRIEMSLRLSAPNGIYETPSEALNAIINKEQTIGGADGIVAFSHKLLNKTQDEWILDNFNDVDIETSKLLKFAINDSILIGAASELDIKESVDKYIATVFLPDDKVVGGMGDLNKNSRLHHGATPSILKVMDKDIVNDLINSLSDIEKEQVLNIDYRDLDPLALTAAVIVSPFMEALDMNWGLKPVAGQAGSYYLQIKNENGVYQTRFIEEVTKDGKTLRSPMMYTVSDYFEKVITGSLIGYYESRLNSFVDNDPNGGPVSDNRLVSSLITDLNFNASDAFKALSNLQGDSANAAVALSYTKEPSLLKEGKHMLKFIELVNNGYIAEDHVAIFLSELDGIPAWARDMQELEDVTEEIAPVRKTVRVQPPRNRIAADTAKINLDNQTIMRNAMATYTREEYDSFSRVKKKELNLPVRPIDLMFAGADHFKPTADSSSQNINTYNQFQFRKKMADFTQEEWLEMPDTERTARGLPVSNIDLYFAGPSYFKQKTKPSSLSVASINTEIRDRLRKIMPYYTYEEWNEMPPSLREEIGLPENNLAVGLAGKNYFAVSPAKNKFEENNAARVGHINLQKALKVQKNMSNYTFDQWKSYSHTKRKSLGLPSGRFDMWAAGGKSYFKGSD